MVILTKWGSICRLRAMDLIPTTLSNRMTTPYPIIKTTKTHLYTTALTKSTVSSNQPTNQVKAVQNFSNWKTTSSKRKSTISKSKSTSSNPPFTSFSTFNPHHTLLNLIITNRATSDRSLLCTMNKDKAHIRQQIRTRLLTRPKSLIEKCPRFSLMSCKNHKNKWSLIGLIPYILLIRPN